MDDAHEYWCGLQGPSSGLELNFSHNEPPRTTGTQSPMHQCAPLTEAVREINSQKTRAVQGPLELRGNCNLLGRDLERIERIRRRKEKDTGVSSSPKVVRGRLGCKARLWGGEGLAPLIDHSPRVAENLLRQQMQRRGHGGDLAIHRTVPSPSHSRRSHSMMDRPSPTGVPRMRPQDVISMARAQSTCSVGVLPQHAHLNTQTHASNPTTPLRTPPQCKVAPDAVPNPQPWPEDETAVAKCAAVRDDLIRRLYFASGELDKVL